MTNDQGMGWGLVMLWTVYSAFVLPSSDVGVVGGDSACCMLAGCLQFERRMSDIVEAAMLTGIQSTNFVGKEGMDDIEGCRDVANMICTVS